MSRKSTPKEEFVVSNPAVDLTNEEFAAIGRVAVAATHLEHYLLLTLTSLLNLTKKDGRILFWTMDFRAKAELLEALFVDRGLSDEEASNFRKIIKRVERLRSDRRLLIHGFWTRIDGQLCVAQFHGGTARANARIGMPFAVTAKGINKRASDLEQVRSDLWAWWKKNAASVGGGMKRSTSH